MFKDVSAREFIVLVGLCWVGSEVENFLRQLEKVLFGSYGLVKS